MKSKGWLLLLLGPVFLFAGGAFLHKEVSVLKIVNTDDFQRPPVFLRVGSQFTLSYIHSIYLEPAAEEFEVGEGEEMTLQGVRTNSAAVAQYYGFEDGREYYPVMRKMKSFALRVGMATPQTLAWGKQKMSFKEIGEKGDRVEVEVARMTLARYLFSRFLKEKG